MDDLLFVQVESLEATWQQNKVVVTYNPIKIEVYRGALLVASVNSYVMWSIAYTLRMIGVLVHCHCGVESSYMDTIPYLPPFLPPSAGLLHFEVHRDPSDNDAPNSWNELFKTHADSKPYGPSSGVSAC